MVPSQKYDVIHYLRETFLKADNPTQYAERRSRVPRPAPERDDARARSRRTSSPGSAMDYGPTPDGDLRSRRRRDELRLQGDRRPARSRARAASREAGTGRSSTTTRCARGGVERRRVHRLERDQLQRHARDPPPSVVGLVDCRQPDRPRLGEPGDRPLRRPSASRDATAAPTARCPAPGPTISGQYRHGDRVILAYSVGETEVLESPGIDGTARLRSSSGSSRSALAQVPMMLQVARGRRRTPRASVGPVAEGRLSRAGTGCRRSMPAMPLQFDGTTRCRNAVTSSDFDMAAWRLSRSPPGSRPVEAGPSSARRPPGDRWVPDGKTLFVREGQLVFDIGWVGAAVSSRRVDDGQPHDVALTYDRVGASWPAFHRRPARSREGAGPAKACWRTGSYPARLHGPGLSPSRILFPRHDRGGPAFQLSHSKPSEIPGS